MSTSFSEIPWVLSGNLIIFPSASSSEYPEQGPTHLLQLLSSVEYISVIF